MVKVVHMDCHELIDVIVDGVGLVALEHYQIPRELGSLDDVPGFVVKYVHRSLHKQCTISTRQLLLLLFLEVALDSHSLREYCSKLLHHVFNDVSMLTLEHNFAGVKARELLTWLVLQDRLEVVGLLAKLKSNLYLGKVIAVHVQVRHVENLQVIS